MYMSVSLQANVQINESVCTEDLFDSYGFNADGNCWVYIVGQGQSGVTHNGAVWVWKGCPTISIRGGLADTGVLQERR